MTERIDSHAQVQPSLHRSEGDRAPGAPGEYRGQRVTHHPDMMSLIADAAEELSFAAGERVEKSLSKRKIAGAPGTRANAMQRAEFYIKKLPDLENRQKLLQFVEHLKKLTGPSSSRIMEEAGSFFKDVSHQFAGLSFAREMLEEQGGDETLRSSVASALEGLLESSGPEIRAGLNVSETAQAFSGENIGGVQDLRDFYRDTVLKYEGFHGTYASIVQNYGETDFPKAVEFLIKAVGNDLQSQGPSISPPELKRVIDDLYQLEVLGNLHRDCDKLLNKLQRQFDEKPTGTARDLMDRLITLKGERWIKSDAVSAITGAMGIRNLEARIYFLRELRNIAGDIPLKVYEDPATREELVKSIQQALDTAIRQEEEAVP